MNCQLNVNYSQYFEKTNGDDVLRNIVIAIEKLIPFVLNAFLLS